MTDNMLSNANDRIIRTIEEYIGSVVSPDSGIKIKFEYDDGVLKLVTLDLDGRPTLGIDPKGFTDKSSFYDIETLITEGMLEDSIRDRLFNIIDLWTLGALPTTEFFQLPTITGQHATKVVG